MLYSQLQNGFEQGFFDVAPLFLVFVAIFLFLTVKRIAARVVLGIAAAGVSMLMMVNAVSAEHSVLTVLWASCAIVLPVTVVALFWKPAVHPSVKTEVGHD